METGQDPACTLLTGGQMYFCTVNVNSRVIMYTLSSAYAFSPAALWVDLEKIEIMRLHNNSYQI